MIGFADFDRSELNPDNIASLFVKHDTEPRSGQTVMVPIGDDKRGCCALGIVGYDRTGSSTEFGQVDWKRLLGNEYFNSFTTGFDDRITNCPYEARNEVEELGRQCAEAAIKARKNNA